MLNILREIVKKVNAADDLSLILKIIVQQVKRAMQADVCSVYLFEAAEQKFVLKATDGLNRAAIGKVKLALGEGLVGLVGLREEPLVVEKASQHPDYIYFAVTGEEKFDAFLGSPIIHQGKVVGVLIVQQKNDRQFEENEEAFLITICAQLASSIAYAKATGMLDAITATTATNQVFAGIAASSGVAIGNLVILANHADLKAVADKQITNINKEISLFNQAVKLVKDDIKHLANKLKKRITAQEYALFDVYLMLLDDNSLTAEIIALIKKGNWAQGALKTVIEQHMRRFAEMEDSYLRERSADIYDLGRRLLGYLQQNSRTTQVYPDKCIVVSEELSPAMFGEIPEDKLVGAISLSGSVNSHVAILARAMGVCSVVCVQNFPYTRLNNAQVIVDGYRGDVIVNPDIKLRNQYVKVINDDNRLKRNLNTLRDLPSETLDGKKVLLQVNVGLLADVVRANEYGAEGVGLYRTEIPFMMNERFPSEAEQVRAYHEQLASVYPHPVTMRTLDIGGDKDLPYFPITETNPFLGWRGIRVTLDHPEIFLVQIKAMLKASADLDNLRILLPMISNLSEVEEAKRLINQALVEVRNEGFIIKMPEIGVMIEVPAAVYQVEQIAQLVDFIAVGSNDLTQYLLAVDRNNRYVARLYDFFHPAVLHALQYIVDKTHSCGKRVSICGEMAAKPEVTILLIAMGFDSLSMDAVNLPKVKWLLRQITFTKMQEIWQQVRQFDNANSIRKFIIAQLQELEIHHVIHPSSDIKIG